MICQVPAAARFCLSTLLVFGLALGPVAMLPVAAADSTTKQSNNQNQAKISEQKQTHGVAQTARMAPLPEKVPPLAPPINGTGSVPTSSTANKDANKDTSAKDTAAVLELEKLMFGEARPNIPMEYRLDRLESEVYHHTNPEWEPARRISRLHETLMGGNANGSNGQADRGQKNSSFSDSQQSGAPYPYEDGHNSNAYAAPNGADFPAPAMPAFNNTTQYNSHGDPIQPGAPPPYYSVRKPDLNAAEYQKVIPRGELERYGLQVINEERTDHGAAPLEWDELAYKVAQELVTDLCKRNTVAHQNSAGENPDLRYTKSGGTDAIIENITAEKTPTKPIPNKAMMYATIMRMLNHQDEREAILSPYATGLALNFNWSSGKDKLITCFEVVTKHAEITEIPASVKVGEKIEVTGVMRPGYKFQKITLAWEGLEQNPAGDAEEQDEALPYFAPLDYEAYARKSEHDWEKATRILQITGIGLALAGGIFMPPVALAAPLIAASTSQIKPHAVSDIPVRGGVRVDGAIFSHKVPIAKDQKEGIYYITVWATSDTDGKLVPVSRRAIIAKNADSSTADISAQPKSSPGAATDEFHSDSVKSTQDHDKMTEARPLLSEKSEAESDSSKSQKSSKHKKDRHAKKHKRMQDISVQETTDGQ